MKSPPHETRPTGRVPVGLGAQIRRHARPYALGALLLGVYQSLTYGFDRGLKYGIDSTFAGHHERGLIVGLSLVLAALVAMGVRVLSRILIFNGGREVEYELRRALLDKLHELGPAFYRRMPTGEIMSRATNDLVQVRLLMGFAALNLCNAAFALPSALLIALPISVKLTFASLSTLPVLILITRSFSRSMFTLTRGNQAALGKMSDRVQASLAGMRARRRGARVVRRGQSRLPRAQPGAGAAARLDGPDDAGPQRRGGGDRFPLRRAAGPRR
jgi:ATP-binding cassette subfamily B multidrug efflux pump